MLYTFFLLVWNSGMILFDSNYLYGPSFNRRHCFNVHHHPTSSGRYGRQIAVEITLFSYREGFFYVGNRRSFDVYSTST